MNTPLIPKVIYGLSLLLILPMATCSPPSDTQARDTLRGFYQGYIQESSKFPVDDARIAALKEKHCTSRLLETLGDAELEADPFLNAQDVDARWALNLEVTLDHSVTNLHQVCFTSLPGSSKHCVKVLMVAEGESWKIDRVDF